LRKVGRTTFLNVPISPTLPTKKCSIWWRNSGINNFFCVSIWDSKCFWRTEESKHSHPNNCIMWEYSNDGIVRALNSTENQNDWLSDLIGIDATNINLNCADFMSCQFITNCDQECDRVFDVSEEESSILFHVVDTFYQTDIVNRICFHDFKWLRPLSIFQIK
jgi:hypothetical protein